MSSKLGPGISIIDPKWSFIRPFLRNNEGIYTLYSTRKVWTKSENTFLSGLLLTLVLTVSRIRELYCEHGRALERYERNANGVIFSNCLASSSTVHRPTEFQLQCFVADKLSLFSRKRFNLVKSWKFMTKYKQESLTEYFLRIIQTNQTKVNDNEGSQ